MLVVAAFSPPCFLPLLTGCGLRSVALATVNLYLDAEEARTLVRDAIRPAVVVAENPAADVIRSSCPELQVIDVAEVDRWFDRDVSEFDIERAVPADPAGWLDHPVVVLCSSGTTGIPKGVVHTNRTLFPCLMLASQGNSNGQQSPTSQRTEVITSGVFWASGVGLQMISAIAGSRTVILPGFDAEEFVRAVEKFKAVTALLPPNCVVSLAKSGLAAGGTLSSLKQILLVGSAMDATTQQWAQRELGVPLTQSYGMTEAMGVCASRSYSTTPAGSVGKVAPNVELKVVDPDSGRILGPDQEGELVFRSPTIMTGYINNPEETAKMFDEDHWFHSGDIGRYDQEGFFYITDRIKSLIKFRGNHVNPAELEGRLLMHPAVQEVAVVGLPHPTDQEHPRAYVVQRPGTTVSEQELVDLANDQLPDYKRLHGGVRFLDELPRTASGKVKLRPLRELARQEASNVRSD